MQRKAGLTTWGPREDQPSAHTHALQTPESCFSPTVTPRDPAWFGSSGGDSVRRAAAGNAMLQAQISIPTGKRSYD